MLLLEPKHRYLVAIKEARTLEGDQSSRVPVEYPVAKDVELGEGPSANH